MPRLGPGLFIPLELASSPAAEVKPVLKQHSKLQDMMISGPKLLCIALPRCMRLKTTTGLRLCIHSDWSESASSPSVEI